MPKRPCKQRAEWRLLPGKPAQHLSEYYKLDCDHGTPLVAIFKAGETGDPLYLCAGHIDQIGRVEKAPSHAGFAKPAPAVIAATQVSALEPESFATKIHSVPAVAEPVSAAPEKPIALASTASNDNSPAERPSEPLRAVGPGPTRVPRIKNEAARLRDLTFGDAAKALVDEAIWNLAPGDHRVYLASLQQGKSVDEAAQAAGGQLAIVHRKLSEYTFTIDSVLSEAKAKIEVAVAINKPLEYAIDDLISNEAIGVSEKDAAMEKLGSLQEWINHGLAKEISPLQAHRIARAIGDRVNWGIGQRIEGEIRSAYVAVYLSLKEAVRTALPHARNLDERLCNLHAAKAELEGAVATKNSQSPAA